MKPRILGVLFFVMVSSLLGALLNPEILMASDLVKVAGIDVSKGARTVISEQATEAKEAVPVAVATMGTVAVANLAATAGTAVLNSGETVSTPKSLADNVEFAWGVQGLTRVASTAIDSGLGVARVGKLVWGHEYTDFGNITKLKIGDTFMVTESGVKRAYRVAANPINGQSGVVLLKKGETALSYAEDAKYSSIDMNALVNYGMGHSLVLLTCQGQGMRYVVVADAI